MNRTLTAALAAAAVLAVPSAAHAATVSSVTKCEAEGRICGSDVFFTAAPGEVNTLKVTQDNTGAYVLNDSTATVTPASGCESVDSHTARCGLASGPGGSPLGRLTAKLGDGNDSLETGTGVSSFVDGGAGADRLNAFAVTYADRTEPIAVDLSLGTGGATGENDTLLGVTFVAGGSGADTLKGSDGNDILDGGAGDDTLEGKAGADSLTGDAGVDAFDGGAGGDDLATRELAGGAREEMVICGSGHDNVGDVDPVDLLAADCEYAQVPEVGDITRAPKFANGRAVFRVDGESECGCVVRLKLSVIRGGKRVTVADARARERRGKLAVSLNRTGRRLLRRGAGVVRLRVDASDGGNRSGYTTVLVR